MAVCQNLVPLVNIKIAGKWMFIPLKMVLIGIDPYPYEYLIYDIHHVTISPGHCRHRIPRCAKRHGVARPQTAGHVVNGQGHVVHDAWKAVHVEVAPDRWKKPREMADQGGELG
jgi:hypothetical protein